MQCPRLQRLSGGAAALAQLTVFGELRSPSRVRSLFAVGGRPPTPPAGRLRRRCLASRTEWAGVLGISCGGRPPHPRGPAVPAVAWRCAHLPGFARCLLWGDNPPQAGCAGGAWRRVRNGLVSSLFLVGGDPHTPAGRLRRRWRGVAFTFPGPLVIDPLHAPAEEGASPYLTLFLACLPALNMETEDTARRVLAAIRDTGAPPSGHTAEEGRYGTFGVHVFRPGAARELRATNRSISVDLWSPATSLGPGTLAGSPLPGPGGTPPLEPGRPAGPGAASGSARPPRPSRQEVKKI
jgi:hypothetical protein